MTDVESVLSDKFRQTPNLIRKILQGDASAHDINTYELYESIYRIRHDAIHWLICQHRELPFGEKPISDVFRLYPEVSEHKKYNLMKDQTPDIIVVNGRRVKITELTISRSKMMEARKYTKYRLLCDVLNECGFEVSLEVIAINSLLSIPDRSFLIEEHGFTDELVEQIYIIIRNIDELLHMVNETENGMIWHAQFRNLMIDNIDFGISDDDVINFHQSCGNKTFRDDEDLKDILIGDYTPEITSEDNDFIDLLVNQAAVIKSPLLESQNRKAAIDKVRRFHEDHQFKSDYSELRSFMPLPYFTKIQNDSSIRRIEDDDALVGSVLSRLKDSSDWFLMLLSDEKNRHHVKPWLFTLTLTKTHKSTIALDGPGRKSFIKNGSDPHIRKQNHRKNIWYAVNDHYSEEIENIALMLSSVTSISSDLICGGPGLDYIQCCQSIYREVNINALRKERKGRNFILRPTGVYGVFVLIHPGGRLRTGENLSVIWFKLIMLKDHWSPTNESKSWVFKKLYNDRNVLHSDWLSTDANRLDHYLRCYDKILMSYACYCSFGKRQLRDELKLHQGNTLGIIMMIYMEDKRSTSKMLQDVRYLVMATLSMYSYYDDVLSKFCEPIRTPLQAYLLDKILKFSGDDSLKDYVLSSKFGNVNIEAGTGETFDRFAGADIQIPRILTNGELINFRQVLCEMYFTMLFNKNQDDPTHASFQILSKILEGEQSLKHVKETSGLHIGHNKNPFEDALWLINHPHKNQFSRTAVMIASKLQSSAKSNKANGGIAHKIASTSYQINKYIDEFATYKSSSIFTNREYNSSVHRTSPKEKEEGKRDSDLGVQNPRRRCIEGVIELINKGHMRSFDLVKDNLKKEIVFQIFKKNQIGGVREILILDIEKRILINILESFSRVICNEDDREMLTHGDRKNGLLRDMIRELKRGPTKKVIMNYNMDKTKWAPSFMPIQFLYMFTPFKKIYPSLYRFICISLINHSNKKFLLPEKLIRAWIKDKDNHYSHTMDDNLQSLKQKFLSDKILAIGNESNMGQGILHYTSSLFHLCFLSLRDEVFKRLCKRYNIDTGEWMDLVSSDDSYTAHALPMDKKQDVLTRIHLFMKSQEVCERVLNVWTSRSKSSLSLLVYEFNSLFGSNLTMFPTTFKFTLAAVQPVNTDSFFKMCKEGYIASRQIVENGGSLELYHLSSTLNKIYAESIYHTNEGGQNDLGLFGLRRDLVPYQLGIYPVMDPATMIMFGPECHNYNVLMNKDKMNDNERKIFNLMHTIVKTTDPEVFSATQSTDSVFVGVNRVEACMGPIKKLESIKRIWGVLSIKEEIHNYVVENPLMMFRKPKDLMELRYKVYMKLFQNSASEALRTTAASIYYGRVAATVSAQAFTIPFVMRDEDGNQVKKTYADCIRHMLTLPDSEFDLGLFYPQMEEYKTVHKLGQLEFDYQPRNALETQNIRSLQLNRIQQRITNSITNLLHHNWIEPIIADPPTSYLRDWINIKELVPVIKDSLPETLEMFQGEKKEQVKSLLLLIMRLMGYGSQPMKAIIYGTSSRAFDQSYLTLKQQNSFSNMSSVENKGVLLSPAVTKVTDKLSFAYNIFSLSINNGYYRGGRKNNSVMDVSGYIDDSDVSSFFLDNTASKATKKKIMIMLIYHGFLGDVSAWSSKTHTIFHQWVIRGRRDDRNRYTGDYVIKAQLGSIILQARYDHRMNKISLGINKLSDMSVVLELIMYIIEMTGNTADAFWKMVDSGPYVISTGQLSIATRDIGFKLKPMVIMPVKYDPDRIIHEEGFITLFDRSGDIIMRTIEGLLHTDYSPKTLNWDIRLMGISLKSIMHLRPFNSHFSIEYCNDRDLVDILLACDNGLRVSRPKVTSVTNQRLKTNFDERPMDDDFEDFLMEEDTKLDDFIESKETGVDLFASVIALSEDEIGMLNNVVNSSPNEMYDSLLDPSFDFSLFQTMFKKRISYHPKKILERVLYIKYHIIAKLLTNTNILNKSTIQNIHTLYRNENLTYSLVYVYDRQFSTTDTPSPDGTLIKVSPTLVKEFKLSSTDESLGGL